MVDWDDLASRIPHRIHFGRGAHVEVCWVDDFPDGKTLGETRFDQKQIVIKRNLNPKLTVITFLHECAHFYSWLYDLDLTETQVLNFEKGLYYMLKPNNYFKRGKKRGKK